MTTTPLPVAVGHPTWEKCGEKAALKVRTGDGDVELSSASVEEEDDGSNSDWDGDVEVGSAEVEEEESGESMERVESRRRAPILVIEALKTKVLIW